MHVLHQELNVYHQIQTSAFPQRLRKDEWKMISELDNRALFSKQKLQVIFFESSFNWLKEHRTATSTRDSAPRLQLFIDGSGKYSITSRQQIHFAYGNNENRK